MKVVLTVDVELWTWRGDFSLDMVQPLEILCEFLEEEEVPAALFLSLSNKGLSESQSDYLKGVKELVKMIGGNNFLEVGIHTHCKNIPVSFLTKADFLSYYNIKQIKEIIGWYVDFAEDLFQRKIYLHRAAGYQIPISSYGEYCQILAEKGILYDSSALFFNFEKEKKNQPVVQIPPSATPRMVKHWQVWSPDTMTFSEMADFYQKWPRPLLVMNAHSYSLTGHSLYYPGSILVNTWFNLPAALQTTFRLPLRLAKKVYRRKLESNGQNLADQSFNVFKDIVSFLKENSCQFLTFSGLKNEYLD